MKRYSDCPHILRDFLTYHEEKDLPREKIARCISLFETDDSWVAQKYALWMKKLLK